MTFCHDSASQSKRNERPNTTEDDSNMYIRASFCYSNPFAVSEHLLQLRFFILLMTSSNTHIGFLSVIIPDLVTWLGICKEDISESEWFHYLFSVCVFQLELEPVRASASLKVLADTVLGSSFYPERRKTRYFWCPVCEVKHPNDRNYFNIITTKTIARR